MNWKSLLAARETSTHFIVEGQIPVSRLKDSPYIIEKELHIGTDLTREEASDLLGFHFHRGHLAIARKPENPPLSIFEHHQGTLVILPEIADPGNLGTIIRNTAALSGSGILLGKGASPYNAKAIRASAGNLFRLPVRQSADLHSDLQRLRDTHTLIGTSLSPHSIPFSELPTIENPALLLGPEDFGLNAEIESLCHHLVHLPMARAVDSLNVASASAIFLHQLQKSFS